MLNIWNFKSNKAIVNTLPELLREVSLYQGNFISEDEELFPVAYQPIVNNSGKLCVSLAMAIARFIQISKGANRNGFCRSTNQIYCEFSGSSNFTTLEIEDTGFLYQIALNIYDPSLSEWLVNFNYSKLEKTKKYEADASLFLLLLYNYKDENSEFFEKIEYIVSNFDIESNKNKVQSNICWIADFLKYETTNTNILEFNIRSLKEKDIPEDFIILEGNLEFKNNSSNSEQEIKTVKMSDIIGKYELRNDLTEKEKLLVPQVDDSYIVSETLIDICEHIYQSSNKKRPIRNILLRGEAGAGKTEMYRAIAAACNLPLYTFAANAMTEPFDLFGQFVPVDENGNEIGEKMSVHSVMPTLPTVEEITFDPVESYQKITGTHKPDATSSECMEACFKLAQETSNNNNSDGKQRFKFVSGQLVYALKYGGLWGFDEVTLPHNSGVVPALNPAMDGTQAITLPTGEIVKRHPACVFVSTTNIDLEGCRKMNQAWQDRCQLIIDVEPPSDEELLSRIKSMTEYDEAEHSFIDLKLFLRAYKELRELAKELCLEDGQIGVRKFADWIESTMITKNPLKSAAWTVISGATADTQGIAELTEKLNNFFM